MPDQVVGYLIVMAIWITLGTVFTNIAHNNGDREAARTLMNLSLAGVIWPVAVFIVIIMGVVRWYRNITAVEDE